MYKDITGIILSGGKSTRMGENKSLMKIGNITIIEQIKMLLLTIFERVIIISNEPELYQYPGIPVYEDIYKDFGPLGGIHSGLTHSETVKNFIISCDMPFITKESIEFIISYKCDNLITIPKANGFVQNLCGIYSKGCLPFIEKILEENSDAETRNSDQQKRKCKVHSLIGIAGAAIIDMQSEYSQYSENLFFNMNKPEDYKYIKICSGLN